MWNISEKLTDTPYFFRRNRDLGTISVYMGRWHNHLNPAICKDAWTEEEDRVIMDAHKMHVYEPRKPIFYIERAYVYTLQCMVSTLHVCGSKI